MNAFTPVLVPIPLGMVKAFLIHGDQAVLVDAGARPGDADRILSAMGRQGVEPTDLALIVITHAHADHCGALSALHHRTGAQVAIQESGAEVVEYVGLAGIVLALIGAVVLYVSSDAGRAITSAIRDVIQATIDGMHRGW